MSTNEPTLEEDEETVRAITADNHGPALECIRNLINIYLLSSMAMWTSRRAIRPRCGAARGEGHRGGRVCRRVYHLDRSLRGV